MVAIQAPYGGSPIANDLTDTPELRRMLSIAFPLLFYGVSRSVEDLSYTSPHGVRAAPPLRLGGAHGGAGHLARLEALAAVAAVARYMLDRYGCPVDGLVPRVDAEIPGSRLVRLDDMDHAEAALVGLPGFSNYYPGDITEALVALALES